MRSGKHNPLPLASHVSPLTIPILWLIALATRLLAVFFLPNAEQDGYSYVETIAQWSAKLATGHFHITDLFGFWLPLFQLTCAIPNVWIDNPLLTGKIVSALCGAASCVLVFAIAEKLTRNFLLACIAFALVLGNPLHILYSAAAMTDVPHGCLILGCIWFVLQKRWVAAAIFGALAEGVRLEAWTLVILLPLIQLACERRISLRALSILLLPPLLWFGLSALATGDPFAYFAQRALYQASYLDFYPSRHGFAWADIRQDADYLLLGATGFGAFAIIVAAGLSIYHVFWRPHQFSGRAAAIVAFAAAIFGFLLLGYVTKRQPVFLPRYGLIFFLLGIPLLAWLFDLILKNFQRPWLARFVVLAAVVVCLWQVWPQVTVIGKVLEDFRAHRQVADTLVTAVHESRDEDARCFSDDVGIRVLSRLPPERFVHSDTAPVEARNAVEIFEAYLREKRVAYLVFVRVENSLPVKFYPQLGRDTKIDMVPFQLVTVAFSPFGPDVWLYRFRNTD